MTRPPHHDEPASPHGDGGLVRLRLDLAYDGAGFSGWARQPDRRTVQGVLEDGLGRVLRLPEAPRVTCAGRTDAGVHARGQVTHVDLPAEVAEPALGTLVRRLRGVLPPDVRVVDAMPAPEGFDARFSATSRRYAYRVCDGEAGPDPLRRHEMLWHRRPLDVGRMNVSAVRLVGAHDFAAFCRRREGATTVRTLRTLSWARGENDLAVATVVADAFCHNMVRALVGAMLAVGEGRRPVAWPGEVLAAGVRDGAVTVVPPHGLTLEEVTYPPPVDLAARAREARRMRLSPSHDHPR